jgi:hypothetical protein
MVLLKRLHLTVAIRQSRTKTEKLGYFFRGCLTVYLV